MQATTERELIDALTALTPMLRDNAALEANAVRAEQERKPVDEVMQAIEDTGAYKWFVPKKYGGYEYSLTGFMEVGLKLGEGCAGCAPPDEAGEAETAEETEAS